jgi:hypothetical protein
MRSTSRRFVPTVDGAERRLLLSTLVVRPAAGDLGVAAPGTSFGRPVDRYGDVQNLDGFPGGEDSDFLDLSRPTATTRDDHRGDGLFS